MERRSVLKVGLALIGPGLCLSLVGCRAEQPNVEAVVSRELGWTFPDTPFGPIPVIVSLPQNASAQRRLPVVIALHGQGESRKAPQAGARGWVDDYDMRGALDRLAAPPLTRLDFLGMIDEGRLATLNRTLRQRPYRGLIVVCPYLPDAFARDEMIDNAERYGRFITEHLLPRVYRETPAIGTAQTTAIDGVSLGGRVALLVGLRKSDAFGAVGALQPAFAVEDVDLLTALAAGARAKNRSLALRLLSSEADRFKPFTLALSQNLHRQQIDHRLDIVQGDHSYAFNRGPGVYELLLYYDRVLRGERYL
jgi:enterochelin esterase-like enzyme